MTSLEQSIQIRVDYFKKNGFSLETAEFLESIFEASPNGEFSLVAMSPYGGADFRFSKLDGEIRTASPIADIGFMIEHSFGEIYTKEKSQCEVFLFQGYDIVSQAVAGADAPATVRLWRVTQHSILPEDAIETERVMIEITENFDVNSTVKAEDAWKFTSVL